MSDQVKITLTEALAELKTIKNRLAKQNATITNNVLLNNKMRDPFEKEGGLREVLPREVQSYVDKTERLVQLRAAISAANAKNTITVAGKTRTIEEWLIWRRESADYLQNLYQQIDRQIDKVRGSAVVTRGLLQQQQSADVEVMIDEADLRSRIDNLTKVLGDLDGLLSLKNATIFIEV